MRCASRLSEFIAEASYSHNLQHEDHFAIYPHLLTHKRTYKAAMALRVYLHNRQALSSGQTCHFLELSASNNNNRIRLSTCWKLLTYAVVVHVVIIIILLASLISSCSILLITNLFYLDSSLDIFDQLTRKP